MTPSERISIDVKSEQESAKLAKLLAREMSGGISVGLSGPLGAGKTTFTRFIVQALKLKDPVSSPSYVLQHIYSDDRLTVEHWDLYRLDKLPIELVEPPNIKTIRIIEWPEKCPDLQDAIDLLVEIKLKSAQVDPIELTECRSFCLSGRLLPHLQTALKHGSCR